MKDLRSALLLFLGLTVVTGVAYPAIVTGIALLAFPRLANGSLIERDGKVVGSDLIGQHFTEAKHFWGRPSATDPPYNAAVSSGSNLGPTNPTLVEAIKARVNALRAAHPGQSGQVPADLATTSASGLDPHISLEAAEYQVQRVATARGMPAEVVRKLVAPNTEHRTFGVLGEPRVNVLLLNLALDAR